MRQPAKRSATAWTLASAFVLLPGSAAGQQLPASPAPGSIPAPDRRPETPFDLSRVAPNRAVGVRDARAGGEAEVAPDVVAAVEAGDLQRGATSTTDTITPVYQRQAQISGRLGVRVGDNGMLFGRLGYAEFDIGEAFPRVASRDFSAGGVLVGAGAEMRLTRSLSLRTEVHSVDYARDLSDRQLLSGLAWRY